MSVCEKGGGESSSVVLDYGEFPPQKVGEKKMSFRSQVHWAPRFWLSEEAIEAAHQPF